MPWRTPDGMYLLEGPAAPFPMRLDRMQLPTGEILTSAPSFYLVAPDGAVLMVYGGQPQASSVEDTMYINPIYAVVGGRLVEYLWIDAWEHDAVEMKERGAALSELTFCAADDLPFDPAEVLAALAAGDQA